MDWTNEKPQDASDLSIAFGGEIRKLLPNYEDVPEQFRRWNGTPENKLVSKLFFSGGTLTPLVAKDGIDREKALRQIRACLASFEPKHEHKEAGCAYMFHLWFTPESIQKTLAENEEHAKRVSQ